MKVRLLLLDLGCAEEGRIRMNNMLRFMFFVWQLVLGNNSVGILGRCNANIFE